MASESPPSEIDSTATSQNIHLEDHVKALSGLSEYIQKLREDLTQLQEIQESSKQELITKILELQETQGTLNIDLNRLANSTNDLKSQFTLLREGQEKLESLASLINQ
jgi:chromosome segregation ATPase